MKSIKTKICIIIALAFTLFATLCAYICLTASANRYVTLSGSSIFTATGAEVWAHRVESEADVADENAHFYSMFVFDNNSDEVTYRRSLAYKWYENSLDEDDYKTSESEDTAQSSNVAPGVGYLSLEIGFEEINFKRFVITFETQQYNMTKDGKAANYVVFTPAADGTKLNATVTTDKDCADPEKNFGSVDATCALDPDHIIIRLKEGESGTEGEYGVEIFNSSALDGSGAVTGDFVTGVFENVGKMYAKYVSSSTNPVVPLSFAAVMPDEKAGNVRMALYELNKQSFLLNRNAEGETASTSRQINRIDDGDGAHHYTGGQVNDTRPPVLCLDKEVSYITYGSEISFSYTAIDVLTQSPSMQKGYILLSNTQLADADFDPLDYKADKYYKTVEDADDQYIFDHSDTYVPTESDYSSVNAFGEDFKPVAAIKIYVKLTDTGSTGGQSTVIFLDWFVNDEYKLHIADNDYIAVAKDGEGAHFNTDNTDATYTVTDSDGNERQLTGWEALVAEYQAEVDKAAADLRAGADDFYLPSPKKLISDNATPYEDMTYTIYYLANGTESQNSSRTSSQLNIDLTSAGDYLFTIYAVDGASNQMWYLNDKGEKTEFASGDIWKMYDEEEGFEGLRSKLPWFSFSAGIADISIEDPGEQDTAYVGVTYTAKAFEIEGVNTSAVYELYLFNSGAYYEAEGVTLTYEQFIKTKAELFKNSRQYFTNIIASSALDETTADYEKFHAYEWNAGSRSFVPQDANSFYLIKCTVSSETSGNRTESEYMGIAASVTPRAIAGEDTWLQDNLTSIILLSIAGAALVGIVLLLVIRPKNKADIDVRYNEEVSSKSKKKGK